MIMTLIGCDTKQMDLEVEVFETSASGNKLKKITEFTTGEKLTTIKLLPEDTFQTITGFGGSFTEASAHLLNNLSKENRKMPCGETDATREGIVEFLENCTMRKQYSLTYSVSTINLPAIWEFSHLSIG